MTKVEALEIARTATANAQEKLAKLTDASERKDAQSVWFDISTANCAILEYIGHQRGVPSPGYSVK